VSGITGLFSVYLLLCNVAFGQGIDLTKVNLVDLMNIEVSSVSKKDQKLSRTASAVFVITEKDIQRSGATNIPDLLRMVPGLDVAQIDSSTWAISARGLNGQYSNKLLVMFDGRTVYSPMTSGVFWNSQIVPLENIERIEVIRGPGATVWGANAVNGVINIITKTSADTLGGELNSGGGTLEHGFGYVRYGGKLGGKTTYRVNSDGFERSQLVDSLGQGSCDAWHVVHGGFRLDTTPSDHDSVTLEGDAHSGVSGEGATFGPSISSPVIGTAPPLPVLSSLFSGWDLSSTWKHVVSSHSETSLQVYFDRDSRHDQDIGFGLNTVNVDFQHHLGFGERQDVVWGLSYRGTSDGTAPQSRITFSPAQKTTHLYSSFVQDEIAILPNRLYLSVGVKLEHNDYSGFGVEPTTRISWTPNERNMFWAAISQAERTPARSDADVRAALFSQPEPDSPPLLITLFGNPKFKNEDIRAFEIGYRTQLSRTVSLDSAVFYNSYDHMASQEPGVPFLQNGPSSVQLVVPTYSANLEYGETHGAEVFADWHVNAHWQLSPGYSYVIAHLHNYASSHDVTSAYILQESSPDHQAQLRSHVDLPRHWAWNASAYFVGSLSEQYIPSYTRLDTNVVWKPSEKLSISVVGQNLLKDRHEEFNGEYSTVSSSMIKRSSYAMLTWHF
jgi:iron complex outermembrane receptor protein